MMKMKESIYYYLISLFILSFALGSCSQTEKSQLTRNGYAVEFLRNVDGDLAKENEHFLYHMAAYADDSLIQSTYDREFPLDFPMMSEEKLAEVKNPVVDALEMMSEGDSLRLTFPYDSITGPNKFGLKPGEHMYYVLTVDAILSKESFDSMKVVVREVEAKRIEAVKQEAEAIEAQVMKDVESFKAGTADLIAHDSGLKYILHEDGTGEKPTLGENISVHYYGVLKENGQMFDNSYQRGQPISFAVGKGQVIRGWDTGLMELKKGSKATLFIPFDQAYGATGRPPTIPAKSDLVFYVHLLDQ